VVGAAVQRVPVQRLVALGALPSWRKQTGQQPVNNNKNLFTLKRRKLKKLQLRINDNNEFKDPY